MNISTAGICFCSKDTMRTRIMIGLTLVFFVQITAQPNILFYASTVLKSVGFQSNEAASLASPRELGSAKVISTVPATLLVDQVGSKPSCVSVPSVMAASLMTMGISNIHMNFTSICRNHSPISPWMSLCFMDQVTHQPAMTLLE